MIETPTLFVLGAGASKPYGYPTGPELRSEIVRHFFTAFQLLLKQDSLINAEEKVKLLKKIPEFINTFKKSSIESIDKFLALNPIFSNFGKMAITQIILTKEKTSKFRENLNDSNEDWYNLLFNRMISTFNTPNDIDKFRENKIAFITFNYDRSLEHFLYESFFNAFSQNSDLIKIGLNWQKKYLPFPIIHVYGQVDNHVINGGSKYGSEVDFEKIQNLSGGIRVIGERSQGMKEQVKDLIANYKRIFFLGFGYAIDNLEAIGLPEGINEEWDIYGTAKGMTEKEINNVKSLFNQFFMNKAYAMIKPRIENRNSNELLRAYLYM